MAVALAKNYSVSRLNLKRNNLKDQTGFIFLEAVKRNKVIEHLNLNGNSINVNVIEKIEEILYLLE